MDNKTICAISSAVGTGAISIVRCSGVDAVKIVNGVFKGKNLLNVPSHTIHYGFIMDKEEVIDEVLVSIMLAPKTFTREDVVEINVHGGVLTTSKVLEVLLNNGCELAEPGEFTKRAFLNGRIDLVEAEAVSDLIEASSEKARKLAIKQIRGGLTTKIEDLRAKLLGLQAELEVNIDFPEYEEAEEYTLDTIKPKLTEINKDVSNLLNTALNGKLVRTGINVVLLGKPNAGKSSILNNLLEENRAIVTNIPGTTRDIIEGKINLEGITLNFIDTAGLRETVDEVEKIGVKKSLDKAQEADLIIHVIDNSERFNFDDLKLLESSDFSFISNARQISLIKKVSECINNALNSVENLVPIDMYTIDIKEAYDLLGKIIGKTYDEDLLDELFSRFCLGK